MKVLNEYPKHHYFEHYEKNEDIFCPNCGKKSVWIEQGAGDCYCGPEHICVECGLNFTMPTFRIKIEARERIIIKQLKTGKTFEPSTPKGN